MKVRIRGEIWVRTSFQPFGKEFPKSPNVNGSNGNEDEGKSMKP